jgi:hypothetical protein
MNRQDLTFLNHGKKYASSLNPFMHDHSTPMVFLRFLWQDKTYSDQEVAYERIMAEKVANRA